jgi:hypothetical protein
MFAKRENTRRSNVALRELRDMFVAVIEHIVLFYVDSKTDRRTRLLKAVGSRKELPTLEGRA